MFASRHLKSRHTARRYHKTRNRRMSVESLETRKLLTTLVVDSVGNVNDGDFSAGNFTLREAISVANVIQGEDTITFDTDGIFATQQTIELAGELAITDSLTIEGTGADQMTIDADGNSRIFNMNSTESHFVVRGLTLTGGVDANNDGPAIRLTAGTLLVEDSVITGNVAQRWGGGIYAESGTDLTVNRSTVSNNAAQWGGGILSYGQTTIDSSTISGNSSSFGGGGLYVADAVITNSTITANTAGSGGGGIDLDGNASLTLENSILAGNSGSSNDDLRIRYGSTVAANYSLVGDAAGVEISGMGNTVGDSTGAGVVDPMLTPLGNYGGVMQTHGLLSGSPALNAGDPTVQFDDANFDQRGTMFFRVQDGRIDMGAHEDLPVELIVDNSSDIHDGVVSSGELSLREAVELANFDPGPNAISFATDGPFAGPTQIDLSGGELVVTESIAIDGPGADRLTIDAGGNSRIFNITAAGGDLSIAGLTLTGAASTAGRGAAVRFEGSGELLVLDSWIVGNSASDLTSGQGYGGGIYAGLSTHLTVRNSTVSGNSGRFGGGILALADLTVENSTVSGNSALFGGGGIFGVNAEIRNSTITHNEGASTHGGAGIEITSNAGASLTLENTIVAGNSTVGGNFRPDLDPHDATLDVNYTMVGDADGVVISGSGNILGDSQGGGLVDPQIGPLADNGGPTPTHALLPGSFAINEGDRFTVAGENGVPLHDQRGTGFTRVYDGRLDMGAFEAQPSGLPDGDFNDDGLYNCDDIDSLVAEIAGGTNSALFDMTGDGFVDLADRDAWLTEAGNANLASGNPYLVADANLDGVVDGLDFIQWNDNKFSNSAAWCQGDFNADGVVDGLDFIEWNTNKFNSSDSLRSRGDSGMLEGEPTTVTEQIEPAMLPPSHALPARPAEFGFEFESSAGSRRAEQVETAEQRAVEQVFAAWV